MYSSMVPPQAGNAPLCCRGIFEVAPCISSRHLRASSRAQYSGTPPPTVPKKVPSGRTIILAPCLRGVEPVLLVTVTSTASWFWRRNSSSFPIQSHIVSKLLVYQNKAPNPFKGTGLYITEPVLLIPAPAFL